MNHSRIDKDGVPMGTVLLAGPAVKKYPELRREDRIPGCPCTGNRVPPSSTVNIPKQRSQNVMAVPRAALA